jgi:hypothetical protein
MQLWPMEQSGKNCDPQAYGAQMPPSHIPEQHSSPVEHPIPNELQGMHVAPISVSAHVPVQQSVPVLHCSLSSMMH